MSDGWAERWKANALGHNTHWGKEGRDGGACLQALSPAWLWYPALPRKMCARVPSARPDPPVQNCLASPGQRCCQNWSQVWTRSLDSTSTNPQKRHLEAVGKQSSRCEIAVQLGVIKEGWVGLLKHINMDVYVLMNLTGSSWEYTRKKLFFPWATCLEFVACLILSYIYLYLTLESIHLRSVVVCIWNVVESWTPEKKDIFSWMRESCCPLSGLFLMWSSYQSSPELHLDALNLKQLRNCPNCKDFSAVKVLPELAGPQSLFRGQ